MLTRTEQAKLNLHEKLMLLFELNNSTTTDLTELKTAIDQTDTAYLELTNAELADKRLKTK